MARATATQIRCMVAGTALPTRRTSLLRGTSWRLSRFTTERLRTPSAELNSTSVESREPLT